jgi:hypothetical protein
MTERIQVKETKRYWGDFEGSLESIISDLQSALNNGWEGIDMEVEQWSQEHEVPYLYKHRPETDKEYERRMKLLEKEKENDLKAKEKRRKEYEKLKKEFEGN